ncbi:hypothetical protein Emtol_0875 [Emticicia oligotrophica DSM 17448]|uniref:Uncharacterized protein n=1 Tax=Emticicia oligotrophica (strain DSM 17448 / CIP 109782 / MTCC 6937 / GPTSA100-15) TaxID=929562 RepID=A0ABM5MXY6_EMTOG|nr:hypothetical protein Emtol_0875 [Emticicia oligotrophica DSM 17448]
MDVGNERRNKSDAIVFFGSLRIINQLKLIFEILQSQFIDMN